MKNRDDEPNMDTDQSQENVSSGQEKIDESKRGALKKAAWVAPVLLSMNMPDKVFAQSAFSPAPPSPGTPGTTTTPAPPTSAPIPAPTPAPTPGPTPAQTP